MFRAFVCLLQVLVKASKVHSVFITGLAFVKPDHRNEASKPSDTFQDDEVLLSISADRSCCVSGVNRTAGNVLAVRLFLACIIFSFCAGACGHLSRLVLFGLLPMLLIFASILILGFIVI